MLGCPGESAGECVLPIARSGTFTLVVAGAVVTVLGTPVVAALERQVRRVLDGRAQRQPCGGHRHLEADRRARAWGQRAARNPSRARAEARHHPAAGELAQIVTGRVAHRGSVDADAARDEDRPRRDRSLNVVPVAPSWPVFCTATV